MRKHSTARCIAIAMVVLIFLSPLTCIADQRNLTTQELKAILAHNRDEEKEHAAMVLEWIRRKDPKLDEELKDYLFTDKPIAHK